MLPEVNANLFGGLIEEKPEEQGEEYNYKINKNDIERIDVYMEDGANLISLTPGLVVFDRKRLELGGKEYEKDEQSNTTYVSEFILNDSLKVGTKNFSAWTWFGAEKRTDKKLTERDIYKVIQHMHKAEEIILADNILKAIKLYNSTGLSLANEIDKNYTEAIKIAYKDNLTSKEINVKYKGIIDKSNKLKENINKLLKDDASESLDGKKYLSDIDKLFKTYESIPYYDSENSYYHCENVLELDSSEFIDNEDENTDPIYKVDMATSQISGALDDIVTLGRVIGGKIKIRAK
jgi:hypothetical protein